VPEVRCPSCLQYSGAENAFCPHCGHRLDEPSSPVAANEKLITGERKFLTLLSCDLQRSTDLISDLDPEAAIERLEPALVAMRTAVRRNGGIVSREAGDGLVALFGAPVADDNHAILACNAALDVVRRIKSLDDPALRVRIGIHSDYAVARIVAGDLSAVYEASGPAMHLLNRLESAAEANQIVVSESCQALVKGLAAFKPLPAKQLKGFTQAVPCYELTGVSDDSRWRVRRAGGLTPFVGRQTEIAALEQAIRKDASSGKVVAVIGDAGTGKSRTVHEFLDRWTGSGGRAIEVEASPLEQGSAFALLRRILRAILGADARNSETLPTPLRAVLEPSFSDAAWDQLDAARRRSSILEGSRALVQQAVTAPTVLLIEDIHWSDSESYAAIAGLFALVKSSPLFILMTSRPTAAAPFKVYDITEIALQTLDERAGLAMLDDLFGTDQRFASLKARVLRHAGGVPLFIEELARQLIDQNILKRRFTQLELEKLWDGLNPSPTVQAAIASRIDRLPKQEKALLQVCAVIGQRITIDLLSVVTLSSRGELQRLLWSLEQRHFLSEAGPASSPSYGFAHDLIREVAYGSILRAERKELHRAVLNGLERRAALTEPDLLCRHALEAGDFSRTDTYGHLAAQRALANSAFSEATQYFETAIAAVDRQPSSNRREERAIDLRIEARLALPRIGQTTRWLEVCREAEQRALALGDEERRLGALAVYASALNFYGAPQEAIAAGEQAVVLAERLGDTRWLSFAEYGLGQASYIAGDYRRSAQSLDRAAARLAARPNRAPPGTTGRSLLVLCYMMSALSHSALGELDEAKIYSEKACELANSNDSIYDTIAATYGAGLVSLAGGDHAQAETLLVEALRLSREHDVNNFLIAILCWLGSIYVQSRDRADEARRVLNEALEAAQTAGATANALQAQLSLGVVSCQQGDVENGLATVRTVVRSTHDKGYRGLEAQALFVLGWLLSSSRNPEAIESLERAIELAGKIEARPVLAAASALLSRVTERLQANNLQSSDLPHRPSGRGSRKT
jgi:class 3 adenylate cyclase/tetratricopeptide (TPR) repeat protein